MEQKTLLSDLLLQIRKFVDEQGYTKGTRYLYIAAINGLRRFYAKNDQTVYSHELTWQFVTERRKQYEDGDIAYDTFLYPWRLSEILDHYCKTGVIIQRYSPAWSHEKLQPKYAEIAAGYEREKLDAGYSINTLVGYRPEIRQFLMFIESKGYRDLSEIKREDISEYIPLLSQRRPAGISGSLTRLRSFFKYLITKSLIDENLYPSLQLVTAERRKVRFGFSLEEIDKMIQSADRNTKLGKRDYAILLLAKHTGLRAIDVMNLKLQDIDWNSKEIRIIQHKTSKPLILPLENNVGNATADYILHARPESSQPHIFIRSKAPYTKLSNACGSAIVRKYSQIAGVIRRPEEYKGFHSFRRALGTRMLSAEVPLHTISEVLGHSNPGSTKPYLATDLEHLNMCALPLDSFLCTKAGLQ